jgi:hypothetical protein
MLRRLWGAVRRWWREPMRHDTASKALDDRGGMM